MITILKEWKNSEGEHYLECYLKTACCGKNFFIRIDGKDNYFWISQMDKCSPFITYQINSALIDWRNKGNKEP